MVAVSNNKIKIQNKTIRNEAYFIYRDLKTDKFWNRNFWIIYIWKRLFFGIFLGALGNVGVVALCLCAIVLLFVRDTKYLMCQDYIYFWAYLPFKTRIKNFKLLFTKSFVLLFYMMNVGIAVSSVQFTIEPNYNFGWAMIVFMQIFILSEIIISWYYIYKNAGPKWFGGTMTNVRLFNLLK